MKNFMPSPGTITDINLPGGNGVRIDTAIYNGYIIPAYYDSISKMKRSLEELVIDGIETNRDFLYEIIKNINFIRGNFDTSFIEKEMLKKED